MVLRRELLRGLGRLNATTTVLQRARLADPLGGMWEAADVQWWWRRPPATDDLALPVWFDDAVRPVPTSTPRWPVAIMAGVAMATSLAVRGKRRSLVLLATSAGVAVVGELLALRVTRALRHHGRPQVAGLPLVLPLAWYAYLAPAYGLAQAACGHRGPWSVAASCALLATATDFANDAWGLASGYWEWRDGGPYAHDVVGANGVAGIPIGNFVGWMCIASVVALVNERHRPSSESAAARDKRTLLLATYLLLGFGGVRWAVATGRTRLAAFAALAMIGGAAGAWLAAGLRRD